MDDFIRRSNRRPRIDLDSARQTFADEAVLTIRAPLPVAVERVQATEDEYAENPNSNERGSIPGSAGSENPKKGKGRFKFKVPVPKTKLQWALTVIAILVLLGGAAFAVYWFIIRDTSPKPVVVTQQPEPEPEPTPEPIYSIVSGREITNASINDRPVYAVQIENSPEARPQSGLKEADIVSEAVAEGGITRFNAIFHDNIPANIGPVRSLRPYYIDFFLPYDAAIVHAGGSPEALSDVRSLGLKDMDSVSTIMRRISQRYSPHNYYTTGQQVLDLATSRGYKPNVASPLPRKYPPKETEAAEETSTEQPAAAGTPAGTVNVKISSALYNVKYTWDAGSGTYLRDQGGSKHIDAESGTQLAPNVVIVPIMNKSVHSDRVHTVYGTVGSGKVYVFQDGKVTEGTWTKSSRSSQWVLKDNAGTEIKLNPGQTWFTITDAAGNVTYSP